MRTISDAERQVLDLLLSIEFEGVDAFRKQARHILAVEPDCICGCPSIKFHIDRSKAPATPAYRLLPTELEELSRPAGVPSSVLCLLDRDGYLAGLECVYYDGVVTEWPAIDRCAVVLRDIERRMTAVLLPSGALVRPRDQEDNWVSFGEEGLGFQATTRKGWNETYDASGKLVSRVMER
ncbi:MULTISPECIES: hypothetical protein [Paenarthrobacter]|uniref:hypothetical protein n=1 Tax=Paenarthrobacter TaxID=1742992 RepID=UPI00236730B7|nr:hypothetical protein [Paenarthrobacter sp. AB444]MDD7834426.1 hypothetical protein [Paenarthrobacter sp. AB444]